MKEKLGDSITKVKDSIKNLNTGGNPLVNIILTVFAFIIVAVVAVGTFAAYVAVMICLPAYLIMVCLNIILPVFMATPPEIGAIPALCIVILIRVLLNIGKSMAD